MLKPILAAVLAALLATVVTAAAHRGHSGGHELLRGDLAGSVPNDPVIHGVTPGAAPWALRRGEVRLRDRGRLDVSVRGLVIPGDPPTTGSVDTVSASLYCAPDVGVAAAPADTTSTEPLSDKGNARIRERIEVPGRCFAPTVLIHPNGDTAHYIAAEGWKLPTN